MSEIRIHGGPDALGVPLLQAHDALQVAWLQVRERTSV